MTNMHTHLRVQLQAGLVVLPAAVSHHRALNSQPVHMHMHTYLRVQLNARLVPLQGAQGGCHQALKPQLIHMHMHMHTHLRVQLNAGLVPLQGAQGGCQQGVDLLGAVGELHGLRCAGKEGLSVTLAD